MISASSGGLNLRRERQFAPHDSGVARGFSCPASNSKMPRAPPNPTPRARPPTKIFPAPAAALPLPAPRGRSRFPARNAGEICDAPCRFPPRVNFRVSRLRFVRARANLRPARKICSASSSNSSAARRNAVTDDLALRFVAAVNGYSHANIARSFCRRRRRRARGNSISGFACSPLSALSAKFRVVHNPPAQMRQFAFASHFWTLDSGLWTPNHSPSQSAKLFAASNFPRRHRRRLRPERLPFFLRDARRSKSACRARGSWRRKAAAIPRRAARGAGAVARASAAGSDNAAPVCGGLTRGHRPNSSSKMISPRRSCSLNGFARSATATTGNSSPLLW